MTRRVLVGRRATPLMALLAVAACGGSGPDADLTAAQKAVEATQASPRRLVYERSAGDETVKVEAVVEDDFRYKAQVSVDGRAIYEVRVIDDAAAARSVGPGGDDLLAVAWGGGDRARAGEIAAALAGGGWVVDPTGAPDPLASVRGTGGRDPVADALNHLRRLSSVVFDAQGVDEFNAFRIDYDPNDDPFLVPAGSSGVTRFDVSPLPLPSVAAAAGDAALPDVEHFRRVALYVSDGGVIRVSEVVDVGFRLSTLEDRYAIDPPRDDSISARGEAASASINRARRVRGLDEISFGRTELAVVTGSEAGGEIVLPSAAAEDPGIFAPAPGT